MGLYNFLHTAYQIFLHTYILSLYLSPLILVMSKSQDKLFGKLCTIGSWTKERSSLCVVWKINTLAGRTTRLIHCVLSMGILKRETDPLLITLAKPRLHKAYHIVFIHFVVLVSNFLVNSAGRHTCFMKYSFTHDKNE